MGNFLGHNQRNDLQQWIADRAKEVFSNPDPAKDLDYKTNQIAINVVNHFEAFLKKLFLH